MPMCPLIDTTAIGYERSKSWKARPLDYHTLWLLLRFLSGAEQVHAQKTVVTIGDGVRVCDECLPNPFMGSKFFGVGSFRLASHLL